MFEHLNIPNRWKHEWTKYPEGYTILEALFNWVKQVNDMVDNQNELSDKVTTFRTELDDFIERFDPRLQEEVTNILSEWQSSGFLDVVIDEALQTQMDVLEQETEQKLSDFNTQLAQIESNLPVYASDFGVSHLNTPTENTGGIRQAVAKAEMENKYVILPSTPPDQPILVNDKITISQNDFTISGYGKSTHIHCESLDTLIFIINGDNCDVGNFKVTGTEHAVGDSAVGLGTVGVQVNGNNVHVHDIYGDLLTTVVRFRNQSLLQIEDGKATNITSGQRVSFGLLISNTVNFKYDNISGSYSYTPSRNEPPHLIYVDQTDGLNYNIQGGYCFAEGGTGSYAYQFKGCIGGNAGILVAKDCEGLCNIMECEDFHIRELTSYSDKWVETTAASLTFGVNPSLLKRSKRIVIDKVYLQVEDGKPIYMTYTDDSVIKNLIVETNHSKSGLDYPEVHLGQSNNNKIISPVIKNIGSVKKEASIKVQSGEGNIIDNPETYGNKVSVLFEDTNTGTNYLKNYALNKQDAPANVRSSSIISTSNYLDTREGLPLIGKASVLSTYEGTNYGYLDTGQRFEVIAGLIRPRVAGGYLEPDSAVQSGSVSVFEAGTPNIRFKGVVKYRTSATVMLRLMDVSNYLQVQLLNGNVILRQRVDGVFSNIAQQAYPINEGRYYEVDVSAYGESITVKINGAEIISETVSTFSEESKFGVGGIGQLSCQWSDLIWTKA